MSLLYSWLILFESIILVQNQLNYQYNKKYQKILKHTLAEVQQYNNSSNKQQLMLKYLIKSHDVMTSNNQNSNIPENENSRPSFRNLIDVEKQKVPSRQKSRRSSHIKKQNSLYSSAIKNASKNNSMSASKPTSQCPNFQKKSIFHHIDVSSVQKEKQQNNNGPSVKTSQNIDINTYSNMMQNMNINVTDQNKDDSEEIQISIQIKDLRDQSNQERALRDSKSNNIDVLNQKRRQSTTGSNSYRKQKSLQQQKQNEQTCNIYANSLIKVSKKVRRLQQKLKTQQKQVVTTKPTTLCLSKDSQSYQHAQKLKTLQNFLTQYEHQLRKQTAEIEESYAQEFARMEDSYDRQIRDAIRVNNSGNIEDMGRRETGEAVWEAIKRVERMLSSQ